MIKAYQKDDEFLNDVRNMAAHQESFHIWWLGQSGYLLQWKGQHVLIDPYLSDSLTHKYALTDKPHIRMSERVIAPQRLDFIDIATSSHNHTDHLDAETLIPLHKANPKLQLIIPEANRAFVTDRLQCELNYPIGLNDKQQHSIGHFTFTGIPAAHNELERDATGNCKYMGYVIQFGPYAVYHSGDTLWREEILEQLNPFKLDLALLPINGNKPERRVAGNLSAEEAVLLAKKLNIRMLIPCHYHMFTFNTEDPEIFARKAKEAEQAYTILTGGERWSSPALRH